jgi:hypothetical protein
MCKRLRDDIVNKVNAAMENDVLQSLRKSRYEIERCINYDNPNFKRCVKYYIKDIVTGCTRGDICDTCKKHFCDTCDEHKLLDKKEEDYRDDEDMSNEDALICVECW